MSREPIARPGDRILAGVKVLDQFKSAKPMHSAVEVVELQVRINTETSPGGAEAVTAGVVGNRASAHLDGDLDHVGVEPDVLGGREWRLMGIH